MNRRELVNAVAAHINNEARDVDKVIRGLTEVITGVVAKGEQVTVSGFAKFVKQERAARMGRNPATGAQIRIKASKKAKITPLKGFKDAVLTPSQAPKLAKGVWPPGTAKAAAKSAAPRTASKATTAKSPAANATTAKATAAKTTARKASATKATTAPARKAATKRAVAPATTTTTTRAAKKTTKS
jgi:DNA-binding protein HU-beta